MRLNIIGFSLASYCWMRMTWLLLDRSTLYSVRLYSREREAAQSGGGEAVKMIRRSRFFEVVITQ